MNYFRQCKLANEDRELVTWIPEKYAKRGATLKLRTTDKRNQLIQNTEWVDGWIVKTVGAARLTEGQVMEWSQDYKTQRVASDI